MRIKIENSQVIGHFFYTGSYEKRIYEGGKRTDKQERNDNGVPLWCIRTELVQPDSAPETVIVVVPLDRDPAEGVKHKQQIGFIDMRLISGARATGGRWERVEAEKVVVRKPKAGK